MVKHFELALKALGGVCELQKCLLLGGCLIKMSSDPEREFPGEVGQVIGKFNLTVLKLGREGHHIGESLMDLITKRTD